MKILDISKNKTKNKVLKDIPIGVMSFIWKKEQKDISIVDMPIRWSVKHEEER